MIPVLLVFLLVTFGLAWPLASRLALDPAEKLGATVALSLLGAYLGSFALYLLKLPSAAYWLLPLLGAAGLLAGRRTLAAMLADADARGLLAGWGLLAAWCLVWLATIVSYSGGGWTGDWYEHWERARNFAEHWPTDARFLGYAEMPARPPLANLVTAGLLGPLGLTFPRYQLLTTLLNTLAFFPAALLARRFRAAAGAVPGAAATAAVLAVLLMLNPSFVQNATFAWTKLIAAGFVLSGLYFFLRAHDADAPAAAGPLCVASLAAGLLAHYSAGPYVVLLAAAWLWRGRAAADRRTWMRRTAQLALLGGLILATWFGWSIAVYGAHSTFLANTTVTAAEAYRGSPLGKMVLNLRDTLVPHFLRSMDDPLIAQTNPWGHVRDWCFQLYQVNLFFLFGSVAWLVLIRELVRGARQAPAGVRRFWLFFAGGAVALGVAVHGARDQWGLAHICLEALLLAGLAYLAAQWPRLGRGWRGLLAAGAALDLGLGIGLQFATQSGVLDRWLAPGRPLLDEMHTYSDSTFMNFAGKVVHQLRFLADVLRPAPALVLALLGVILMFALTRARPFGAPSD